MANNNILINTAQTLDVHSSPGQDLRFPTTLSDSIFTFGNFQLQKNIQSDTLETIQQKNGFSRFTTLESLSSTIFDSNKVIPNKETTDIRELNQDKTNPQSYSYFGSFYSKVATSINNIITTFPYAILSKSPNGINNSIFDYSNDTHNNTSSFKIPISGLTNQGNIPFVSGASDNNSILTVYDNTNQFSIQLSGSTNNDILDILNYSYIQTGVTGYLNFKVKGLLFSGSTPQSTYTSSLYIRPTLQRFNQYKRTISNLENQLLFDGTFLVPNTDDDSTFTNQTFVWPKTFDGFNPDGYGTNFETYSTEILNSCQRIDEIKTNWMIRTMIPENYLELDTDSQIYNKLISVYTEEFDKVKVYIDQIAFMHSTSYNNKEDLPNKFLHQFSKLLGLEFADSFSDTDIFEYLAGEVDDSGKSFSDYNIELWKKILSNINWLFKKKGTRDALSFIFKLIGAPDGLVNFNEFVYKVNKSFTSDSLISSKANERGYIDYNQSSYPFQQGNNGMDYINQWNPEFELEKVVDNKKTITGSTDFNGTENILNTKELAADINPALAIETDVKEWFDLGYGVWNWGNTGMTFSGMSVPFEWAIDDYNILQQSITTGMSISQWVDYIYTSFVEPRTRKVEGNGHSFIYLNLKKVYMTYYLWTNNQYSNRLTFRKLEKFLTLIERNFQNYVPQLIPATTILEGGGTTYRNSIFNRQKFVYQKGINDGSEFQIVLPLQVEPIINAVKVSSTVNNVINPIINAVDIIGKINEPIKPIINAVNINSNITEEIKKAIHSTKIQSNLTDIIQRNINSIHTNGIIRESVDLLNLQNSVFSGTIFGNSRDFQLVSFDEN